MTTSAETALVNGLFAALTAWLQNKDRTDIPQEMHEAMDAAHAEMRRIGFPIADPSTGVPPSA